MYSIPKLLQQVFTRLRLLPGFDRLAFNYDVMQLNIHVKFFYEK